MAARWTSKEDLLLARLYRAGLPRRAIAARLGRSEDALDARRRSIGIPARSAPRAWSALEDTLIRRAIEAGIPLSELAGRVRRPYESVLRRARKLGLARSPGRRFSPVEDEALRAAWREGGTLETVAARLGRSPGSLRLRAKALGLATPSRRLRWSPAEDLLLRRGYAEGLTCPAIAARLLPDRSPGAVAARARKLGLATYARLWSPEEDRTLTELVAVGTSLEDAGATLVRTPEAIRRRTRKLELGPLPPGRHANARRRWREEEETILRQDPSVDPLSLARALGRSDAAVRRRLAALGLRPAGEPSPHHRVPVSEGLSPGELRLLAREIAAGNRRFLSLSRRLGCPPAALRRTAAALQASDQEEAGKRPALRAQSPSAATRKSSSAA